MTTPLDLTRHVPRSPFEELQGFPWLPRMIDKARAYFAGTHGEYSAYPCPGDKGFLKHFGLDHEALGALIKGGASEEAIATWVQANARDGSDAAKAAFRRTQRDRPGNPFMRLVVRVFAWTLRKAIRAKSPQVGPAQLVTLAHVIAAEEGHALP